MRPDRGGLGRLKDVGLWDSGGLRGGRSKDT